MITVRQYWWSTTCQIMNRIHLNKRIVQKSGNNHCEYETVDVLLGSGSDTFSIGGDAWVVEILTNIKLQ